ncbi:hypothetical protein SFA35_25110 (plasmid) [Pseudomonas sp. HR96]|uniref:hypothetical protein n=1 Tax=Pseudomonas sp. HR96 TaxID=1027966 RepID=UPI002A7650C5|nr:hypothetical protein [Pseudomonas sp. HR96]WPP02449.1 hypothetical protein SFA35_25110 [Pseudomonas sp. HR96]
MLQLDTHETAQARIDHVGVFQGQEIAIAKVVMLLTGGECVAVTEGYDGGNPGSVNGIWQTSRQASGMVEG